MKAIVVFHGGGEKGVDGVPTHPLNRLLRDGFKHCFVCVLDGENWMKVDGLAGIPSVGFVTTSDFDLAGFYREQGLTVVETEQRQKALTTPFIVNNCVGLVKAVLCLSAPFVWSPWRLYRNLTRKNHG